MSHSFQFQIDERDAGRRVDDFLALRLGSLSRMRIANLIDAGVCFVNGDAAPAGYRIVSGDSVEISFDDGAPTAMSPEPIALEVVHEDDHVIVVAKPAGILVHPTMSVKTGTLANALAYHLNRSRIEDGEWRIDTQSSILNPGHAVTRPGIVHRLDRATSGLIVIAKTPGALTVLSRHFRKRLVEKKYLALVRGNVEADVGSISAPIARDPDQRPRWRIMESGKPAQTRFRVIDRLRRATLLELEPVTGRTNQLRIHCAHIGHPIVGDEMYGICESRNEDRGLESSVEDKEIPPHPSETRVPQAAMRLCLHAWKLAFHHPASGDRMQFISPLPHEMAAIVGLYRKG